MGSEVAVYVITCSMFGPFNALGEQKCLIVGNKCQRKTTAHLT